ncbi:MAG TPA: molybdenum cofactor biosynthesis protein MoaE [Solirubrobacteraceae bacterium]|jgi:molybdopterin synthase catalytic subunit|nr:molybdenum cofactor biosynthesis protein MoaE [Solirubrobacteraceae bacterium]
MKVRIRLFAGLRERAGSDQVELELPEESRVRDALDQLRSVTSDVPVVMAINQEYANEDAILRAGDELALIPPVSGGSGAPGAAGAPRIHARVIDHAIAVDPMLAFVRDPAAGAVVTFHGVTREVEELEYEAYAEMAERQIAEIVSEALDRHGLCAAAAEHRTGTVARSEPSVVVAVSAPHRGEAFAGAREIIDRIKAQAPIWKKESGDWVKGSTPAV